MNTNAAGQKYNVLECFRIVKDSVKEEIRKRVHLTKFDEPMKNHITFKVGGPAEVYIEPAIPELYDLIPFLEKNGIDYEVVGNGSNLLVSDKGIKGLVINISKELIPISVCDFSMNSLETGENVYKEEVADDETMLMVPAGTPLSMAANSAAARGLTGMEELSGIPGTIGGAAYMNAGAYGREMKDITFRVDAIKHGKGEVQYVGNELGFSYRHSIFMAENKVLDWEQEHHFPIIITGVYLHLKKGDEKEIREKMADFARKRLEKQPLEYPSAGSTFKRPEGYFAGKLIQDAGLKGFSIGGAEVSEKHSGFIINKGNASASDIYQLIQEVQKRVLDDSGVSLEPEVRMLGEF